MEGYVLEMKNIYKSFPGVKVLEDVNLQIKPGEVHALMGENGAGKSTLMKILMGIYKADQGTIILQGKETTMHGPKDAMNKGISMIHQELNTLLDMEVAENVFVGRELLKKGFSKMKIVDIDKMREETARYFHEMKIDINPRAKMRTLSVAEMQLVEIVKAISLNSKIIVMDEPTSAITEKEALVLFEQIDRLKKQGVAIIYISHKMDEIFRISDTITVLRDGQWIGTTPVNQLDDNSLIKMMVGRELTDIYPKEPTEIGDVILKVDDLSRGKKVKNVSFSLKKGEVLGIAGLVGAGRSELVETIFGLYHKTGGSVELNGKKVNIKSPQDAIKNKIALITEDRKQTGLNLIGSVKENISTVSIKKLSNHGLINKKQEGEVADKYIQELKIKTPSGNAIVGNLSGGNQQKVVLAKWLLDEPDIVIFDEPTRGIDIGAKRDIYLLINELAKSGKAIIVISSEMAEVMGISDRIIVMCEGELKGEIQRENFSQELIMSYASNIEGRAV
ncbi:MAG: sugar ABC transporter ATP-binding protein [Clostridia bacterium]|nr:sugar ABC transporter ATP-binding protein [Clostridia bacterium]